jgi:putative hemolysin
MWAGILAYLDRYGYDYVTGCVSVPIGDESDDDAPGSQLRGVRDFIVQRHGAPPQYRVTPYRPVVVNGKPIDDIAPPPRPAVPALMRGYLRLGAKVCGEPAHDPDFGVGDFCVLLDKKHADTRYLRRLRSVSAASEISGEMAGGER